ncbi:hypothetical protein ANAPC5_01353 [Anaplasma phagocytophilum]|nr:hypothetical protein ANAPC5_01353 [Anaplasma phagocytophilum]
MNPSLKTPTKVASLSLFHIVAKSTRCDVSGSHVYWRVLSGSQSPSSLFNKIVRFFFCGILRLQEWQEDVVCFTKAVRIV